MLSQYEVFYHDIATIIIPYCTSLICTRTPIILTIAIISDCCTQVVSCDQSCDPVFKENSQVNISFKYGSSTVSDAYH